MGHHVHPTRYIAFQYWTMYKFTSAKQNLCSRRVATRCKVCSKLLFSQGISYDTFHSPPSVSKQFV
jgi:hypothetical protein